MNSTDPIGLITAIATALPGGAAYIPMILAYLSLIGGICVAVVAFVPAPVSTSPAWWLAAFKVINFIAGNFGRARNAVAPGMRPAVAVAALESAKVTAAAPELAVIAPVLSPNGAAVISSTAKGS